MDAAPDRQSTVSLGAGEYAQVYVKVDESSSGDRVSQAFELLLGSPGTGWVFSFPSGSTSAGHGNLKINGRYSPAKFSPAAWKPGGWNELRLARCGDGHARLWVNDVEVSQSLANLGSEPLEPEF